MGSPYGFVGMTGQAASLTGLVGMATHWGPNLRGVPRADPWSGLPKPSGHPARTQTQSPTSKPTPPADASGGSCMSTSDHLLQVNPETVGAAEVGAVVIARAESAVTVAVSDRRMIENMMLVSCFLEVHQRGSWDGIHARPRTVLMKYR